MDFTYTHISTEKSFKKAFYSYLNTIYSKPLIIFIDILIVIVMVPAIITVKRFDEVTVILCFAMAMVALKPLKGYYFCISLKKAMRHAKIFGTPQEIRLTDTFIEIKRGDNISKNLYSESYTHYIFDRKTSVIFQNGRFFAGGLDLTQLEQAGLMNEFLTALEKAGVKRKPYRPWINICDNILRVSAVVIWLLTIVKMLII